jgi:hypothetical protein
VIDIAQIISSDFLPGVPVKLAEPIQRRIPD